MQVNNKYGFGTTSKQWIKRKLSHSELNNVTDLSNKADQNQVHAWWWCDALHPPCCVTVVITSEFNETEIFVVINAAADVRPLLWQLYKSLETDCHSKMALGVAKKLRAGNPTP